MLRDVRLAWKAGQEHGLRGGRSSECPYGPSAELDGWMAGYKVGSEGRPKSLRRRGRSPRELVGPASQNVTPGRSHAGGSSRAKSVVTGTGPAMPIVTATIEEPSGFAGSCLPKTMQLARRYKATLLTKLLRIGRRYAFEDRVLIWLGPQWAVDVEAYHSSNGRQLISQFKEHQLQHFDELYERELLTRLSGL